MLQAEPVRPQRQPAATWGVVLFVCVLVAGLYYVKWHPYYHKALLAAAKHSIGNSIIAGKAAAPPAVGWRAAWDYTVTYVQSIWQALVVGLLVGSGVQALLPRTWLLRVLGRTGFASTAIAGLAAVPAMMCTCCAAPAAVGLKKSQASVGATLAFWLGNPVLNPATMIFMGFVLGWHWAALRLVVGLVLVFGVAYLAQRFVGAEDVPAEAAAAVAAPDDARPLLVRWGAALWELAVSLLPEYAVILLVLGAVRAWLFPAMNPAVGHSLWLMLALAVAGTLFVIPTAGEIPVVQSLMAFGLGSGGAGVLLTTLPAVSLPSLVMLGRAVPARALVLVAVSVAVLGLLTGAVAMALHF
jgi:uncharacterized membrane protein YraQ (UPF0718 family)